MLRAFRHPENGHEKQGERVATCVCADVSLEVKGVVEAFAAEGAQVSLGVTVALNVSVQHALVLERLLANLKRKPFTGTSPLLNTQHDCNSGQGQPLQMRFNLLFSSDFGDFNGTMSSH